MIIQKRKEKIFDYGLILLLKPAVLVNFNLEFRCLSKRNLQVFIITYLLGSPFISVKIATDVLVHRLNILVEN